MNVTKESEVQATTDDPHFSSFKKCPWGEKKSSVYFVQYIDSPVEIRLGIIFSLQTNFCSFMDSNSSLHDIPIFPTHTKKLDFDNAPRRANICALC